MLHKTEGIVLNYLKYGETSIIVRIYTDAFGLQAYIVNGVRSSKSKNKIALYQPLTLLELVVYHSSQKDLHRIKEVKCSASFRTIPFDFRKSGIALFMTEVLLKVIKREEGNKALFNFLQHSVLMLDHLDTHCSNFHLQFLLGLSSYLGFAPGTAEELYQQVHPAGSGDGFAKDEKRILELLLNEGYESIISISAVQRRAILQNILHFYRLHTDQFGELKSLNVLQEVMGN